MLQTLGNHSAISPLGQLTSLRPHTLKCTDEGKEEGLGQAAA